jgi:diguanylate cyclase (GGDEF)-like protein
VVSQLQEFNRDLEARVIARTAELAAANRQLAYQATHDPLTGLANRVLFDDRLQNALDRRRRNPALLGVLLLDLDGFKAVNDTHGHAVGDEVLATVGERLRHLMRTEDTVARLGGDEFAIVLDAGVKDQAVEAVTQRIIASLTQPIRVGGGFTVSVGASIGAAMTDGAVEAAQLLREADSQMYAVKRNGKGRASIRAVTPMLA